MKHPIRIFTFITAILLVIACSDHGKNKANSDDKSFLIVGDSIDDQGVQRAQRSETCQTIPFKGEDYQSYILRTPSDSLPIVKNDTGDKYADNVIALRLSRGGKTIFSKRFTKHSFSSIVDEKFLRHATLEGMVFDKVTNDGFLYAVSVSYPQTDLYIPMVMTITREGKMSVKKDERPEEGIE